MIEDDGGFMRRETAREWVCAPDEDLTVCESCDNFTESAEVCPACGEPQWQDDEYDGQPTEYDEWQDFYGGDDWDHGQYDGDW